MLEIYVIMEDVEITVVGMVTVMGNSFIKGKVGVGF